MKKLSGLALAMVFAGMPLTASAALEISGFSEALRDLHYRAKMPMRQTSTPRSLPLRQDGIVSELRSPELFLMEPAVMAPSQSKSQTLAQADERQAEADRLLQQGIQQSRTSQFQAALESWQQALEIYQRIGDRQGEANALGNLGIAYDSLSDYQRAIDFLEQSLVIARQIGDRQGEANALSNLGNAYNSLGDYPRAIDFHQQYLEIARQIGDRQGEAISLGNLGIAYYSLGDYPRAIDFHQQSLEIARQIGDRQGEANALGNLGIAYDSLGDYPRAIDFYQQTLDITRQIGDRQGEAISLGNLGIVYRSLGDYPRAIDFHQQSLEIVRQIGDRQGEAASLGNLGNAYYSLDDYPRAIDFHQQSLEIDQQIGDRRGEADSLNNLGLALLNTNQFATAETTLTQSIEVYESLRADLPDAQLISIADTQSLAYTSLERALIAQNKHTEALAITERGRAQAFALQLALRQNSDNTEPPVTYPSIADIQRIARDQNATLVTYSLSFDQALYIWVVSPTGDVQFRSVEFNGSEAPINPIATIDGPVYRGDSAPSELDTLVADSRSGIAVVGGGIPDEQLKDLHQVLIGPIADLLPPDPEANVVFVPQGSLFLVPFAALQDADGTYLIEKHTITTAPSIQVLGLAAEEATGSASQPASNALIVGNPVMPSIPEITLSPLPGAEAEAVAIGELLNLSPLLGNQATEAQIKRQMPTADLIHLATHGLLSYSDSSFEIPGAVALTPGNGEDGLLTAGEILDMDLQAQLAILSACDTGRGQITGDGVVGLSRSLITAGVPSVVVSLWAVPDAPTAELMTAFYE
ncbi:MAG: CHAT domain-containing tetratricopeptide repeat protein, partial [Cyanobacteria bacterium J06639_16]